MAASRGGITNSTGGVPSAPRAGMHRVQVVGRVQTARDVVTLWLAAPATLQAPAPYQPGQFVTLALMTDRGPLYRSYSLCGDGSTDHPWEITVKRQHAGVVSSYIYDRVRQGQILYVSEPAGRFVLPSPLRRETPLIFVALGSGITPIYGMLRALARVPAQGRPPIQLHYAYSTPADAIYGRELAALDPQRAWLIQWHYISSQGSRLTPEQILALAGPLAAPADWYICGSAEFKRGLEAVLVRRGVPTAHVHAELFSSPASPGAQAGLLPAATGRTAAVAAVGATGRQVAVPTRVLLAQERVALDARPGETLLELLERNGYNPAFSCRAGSCGTCALRVLSGRVSQPAGVALSPEERAHGYVLSCVAHPVGEVTLASAQAGVGSATAGIAAVGATRSSGRRAMRRALRLALAAASLALFARTWTLTSGFTLAQGSNPAGTTQPVATPCASSSDDDAGDDSAACTQPTQPGQSAQPAPTATPSGPSSIWTHPTFPTPPPSTSSGSSR